MIFPKGVKLNRGTNLSAVMYLGSGVLLLAAGINTSLVAIYVQLFNKAVVPVINDIPLISIYVPTLTNYSFLPVLTESGGFYFDLGIAVGCSTVASTYQPTGTPDITWFSEVGAIT